MAIKKAVTEKFQDYLYRSKLAAVTDNNSFPCILMPAKLDDTDQHWVASTACDFILVYRSGMRIAEVNILSSLPDYLDQVCCWVNLKAILCATSATAEDEPIVRIWFYKKQAYSYKLEHTVKVMPFTFPGQMFSYFKDVEPIMLLSKITISIKVYRTK